MKTKKVKGFTLIELIVVIAIIAVLAAILIPSLMGYVGKASLRTANSNAKAIATNSATIISDLEAAGTYVSAAGSATYTAAIEFTGNEPTVDFETQVEKAAGLKAGSTWAVQVDADGSVLAAAYSKDGNKAYIGSWPNEATSKNQYNDLADALSKAQTTAKTTG